MCRTIAWDAIVLGGNKQRGKLSADNYVKDICLWSIIRGQFSGWQLLRGNYQYSIILCGNSLSVTCPRANYPGAITGEAIFGEQLSEDNNPGVNYPWGNCPGGNYPRGNCPRTIFLCLYFNLILFTSTEFCTILTQFETCWKNMVKTCRSISKLKFQPCL